MVTIDEWYRRVNAVIPHNTPPPTGKQAINAVRRLYRFVMKRKMKFKVKLTSGRRYTWRRGDTFFVNPNRPGWRHSGWHALIHDLSHYLHRWKIGGKPHAKSHAKLELRLAKECVRRGWISAGKPAVELPQAPPAERREEQAVGQPA